MEQAQTAQKDQSSWWDRLLGLLGAVFFVACVILILILAFLQSDWGSRYVIDRVLIDAQPLAPAEFVYDDVSFSKLSTLSITNLAIIRRDTSTSAVDTLAQVDRATLRVELPRLLGGILLVREMNIAGAYLFLNEQQDGSWNWTGIGPTTPAPSPNPTADRASGGGLFVDIMRVSLQSSGMRIRERRASGIHVTQAAFEEADIARIRLDTSAFAIDDARISATLSTTGAEGTLQLFTRISTDPASVQIDTLTLTGPRTRIEANASLPRLTQDLRAAKNLRAAIDIRPLTFADLAPYAPALTGQGTLEGTIRTEASDGAASIEADLSLDVGGRILVSGEAQPRTNQQPLHVSGTVQVDSLALGSLINGLPPYVSAYLETNLTAPENTSTTGYLNLQTEHLWIDTASLGLRSDSGNVALDLALKQEGLDIEGQLSGRPFDSLATYQGSLRLRKLDLSTLSALTPKSDLAGEINLIGQGYSGDALQSRLSLTLGPSTLGRDTLSGGMVDLGFSGAAITLGAELRSNRGGQAETGLTLVYADTSDLRVERGQFRLMNAPIAAWMGDSTASSVSVEGTFSAKGQTLPALYARLDAIGTDIHWGDVTAPAVHLSAELQRGQLASQLELGEQAAPRQLELRTTARIGTDPLMLSSVELYLTELDLSAYLPSRFPATRLSGQGQWRVAGANDPTSGTISLGVSPSWWGGHPLPTLQSDLAVDTLQVRGTLEGAYGPGVFSLPLAGDLEEGSLFISGGRFADLDAFYGLSENPSGNQTQLNGTVGFVLKPTDAGPNITASIGFLPSSVNSGEISSGLIQFISEGNAQQGTLDLFTQDGSLSVETYLAALADGSRRAQLAASWDGLDIGVWSATPSIPSNLRGTLRVEGAQVDENQWESRTQLVASGQLDEIQLTDLSSIFDLSSEGFDLQSLQLQSNLAEASASGRIPFYPSATADGDAVADQAALETPGSLDVQQHDADVRRDTLTWLATLQDVQVLEDLLGLDRFSVSQGRLSGAIVSSPLGRALRNQIELFGLRLNQAQLFRVTSNTEASIATDNTINQLTSTLEAINTDVGSLKMPRWTADVSLTSDGANLRLAANLGQDRAAGMAATLRVAEQTQLQIQSLDVQLVPGEPGIALAQPATIMLDDGFTLDAFTMVRDDERIDIRGGVHPRGTQDLRAVLQHVETGPFFDLFGFTNLSGKVNGSLAISGEAAAPVMFGQVAWEGRQRGRTDHDVTVLLNYSDRSLEIDGNIQQDASGQLRMRGAIPADFGLNPDRVREPLGDYLFSIEAQEYQLDLFREFVPKALVSDLRGRLNGSVVIGGSPYAPDLSGALTLAGIEIALPELGTRYRSGQGTLRFEQNQAVVERLRLEAGGALTATGTITFGSLLEPYFDLSLRGDGFRAMDVANYMQTAISGTGRYEGNWNAAKLTGDVELTSADFYITNETNADFEPVTLSESDLRLVERRFGIRVEASDTTDYDWYDALDIDLSVRMQRDTWIRSRVNPEINVQFTGDLDVRKPLNGAEEAFGVITVVPERSYLKYLGKEFLIQRGSLTFNGDPLNPILDLESVYEVRSRRSTTENEATITLNLAGPFDNLNPPELVSDPPMEVADQVSYILFGRPSDESLKLSSNNLNVSDFAIGTLAGALEDLASSRLGLDVVEIEQREDQRMVLTAGRYLNSRVYVAVSQPISTSLTGEGSLLAIEEGLSGYTVEYQIVDQVLLRLLGNGAVIRLNLQWTYTF